MRLKTLCATAMTVLALSGCATQQQQASQEQAGMIIGGIIGGVLGAQIGEGRGRSTATVIGTIIGAVIGGNVGRSMDETDRMKTGLALENVRTGVPSSWRNPDTGNFYTVTPTRTYETAQSPCRDYTVDAVIDGRNEKLNGTACRQADGSWRTSN